MESYGSRKMDMKNRQETSRRLDFVGSGSFGG
jgi:hypothetical protein